MQEAIKSRLPAPPEGFVWHMYKNVIFPKPEFWKEREISESMFGMPFVTYAASPEDFSLQKQFETGITIQIIAGPQRVLGIAAKKTALAQLKPIIDTHKREDILMFETGAQGEYERTFFRYKDAPPGLKPIIVHMFILASDVNDIVYTFTFESPTETWNDHWAKYGMPILSKLKVLTTAPPN